MFSIRNYNIGVFYTFILWLWALKQQQQLFDDNATQIKFQGIILVNRCIFCIK